MWARAALACAAVLACARAWPGGAVCARRAAAAGGARYVAFLSRGPGPPALVESAWAGRGRLLACWARRDPRLARAFRAACARRPPAAPGAALRRELAALWRRRAACTDPEPRGERRRRRRGWTVPGTLWCGAGNSAGNATELGLFRGPDRCCREHDQCEAQITALQFNYGIRNYRLHTVSHCDCDARFRRCLLALNDTISNIIGVTFFNLLEVPCFVLEDSEECVQWHWWGGCERYGVVPLARMVQQGQYGHGLPAEGSDGGRGRKPSGAGRKRLRQGLGRGPGLRRVRRPVTAQHPRGPGASSPASARDEAEPAARRAAPWGELEPGLPTAVATLEQELAGGQQGPGASARPALEASPEDSSIGSSLATEPCEAVPAPPGNGRRQQGLGRMCRCYKRLDKCEYQIAPHELKYQLHNADTRTLFHCNCTRRLARSLRRAKGFNEVQAAVLADHVAAACFVLEPLTNCSLGKEPQRNSCTSATRAVLVVPARHLKNILRRWGAPRITSKVKHQDWKTQGSGSTLYEQCRQLALEQKLCAQRHTAPR
ncbi:group 3 secretory phospholipase A2 isoform X1 [Anser cygnoides]|uniref:group 3 secretory phospholipase A2 isoform X1 n=1 Tax=Anser cygnoides TaxID=8845 RepID=UPI0034D33A22